MCRNLILNIEYFIFDFYLNNQYAQLLDCGFIVEHSCSVISVNQGCSKVADRDEVLTGSQNCFKPLHLLQLLDHRINQRQKLLVGARNGSL